MLFHCKVEQLYTIQIVSWIELSYIEPAVRNGFRAELQNQTECIFILYGDKNRRLPDRGKTGASGSEC